MSALRRLLTYQGIPVWRHTRIIQWVLQFVSGVVAVALVAWFLANMSGAIAARDIPFGFSFLSREYQTPIGEHFIPYESTDTFLYAIIVAITNTLLVSVLGVILATALGIAIGVSRLSENWMVSKLALAYIEFFRNVPLLVQLLFWFFIILTLPPVREGIDLLGVIHINNSGLSFPGPSGIASLPVTLAWLACVGLAVPASFVAYRMLNRRELATGRSSYPALAGCGVAALIIIGSWAALASVSGEPPFVLSLAEHRGRFERISGGITIRAGLLVLLLGLVVYTAAFIAEIVRGGIQSVGRGQVEAARALGLSPIDALRSVIFPQAMRVVVPPLISQFLNLTKNSSLGGAVGYTELTNVGTTMTQTAPAVSIFLLIMLAYLAMSLTYSLIGNLYNRHISFEGR